MEQKRKNFPSLSGLKAVMCLIIVWYHTLQATPLVEAIPFTAMIRYFGGSLGNSVFFMISGFLMVNGYRDRIRSDSVGFGPFVYDKICKFYALYLLTNFLSMILRILRYGLSSINLHDLAMILLLQDGGVLRDQYPYNGPTWFVSMLLVLNIAFFAVCYFARKPTAYRCALAGMIVWGYAAMTHDLKIPLLHTLMGVGLVNFFLGCVLAEVYPFIREQTHRWLSGLVLLALAASGILMVYNGVDNTLGSQLPGIAFGLSPMIVYSALANPLLCRLLGCKPMKNLGKISISIFFWHMVVYEAVIQLLEHFSGTQTLTDLQYLGYLLLMLGVSVLSYRYLEKGLFRKKSLPENVDFQENSRK